MKLLLALLFLALPLSAQEATVELRVIVFPRSADKAPLSLQVGKKLIEIELASNRLTGPYKVAAQPTWSFGVPDTNEKGGAIFKVLGSGTALPAPSQLLILFRKGPTNEDGFTVVAYPGGTRRFGGGQFLILNLTKDPVGGDIGDVKFGLKPAGHTIISPKPNAGDGLCHASILLNREDRWLPLIATNWPLRDDARGLIFVYQDPRSGKIQLHTIRDFL